MAFLDTLRHGPLLKSAAEAEMLVGAEPSPQRNQTTTREPPATQDPLHPSPDMTSAMFPTHTQRTILSSGQRGVPSHGCHNGDSPPIDTPAPTNQIEWNSDGVPSEECALETAQHGPAPPAPADAA